MPKDQSREVGLFHLDRRLIFSSYRGAQPGVGNQRATGPQLLNLYLLTMDNSGRRSIPMSPGPQGKTANTHSRVVGLWHEEKQQINIQQLWACGTLVSHTRLCTTAGREETSRATRRGCARKNSKHTKHEQWWGEGTCTKCWSVMIDRGWRSIPSCVQGTTAVRGGGPVSVQFSI